MTRLLVGSLGLVVWRPRLRRLDFAAQDSRRDSPGLRRHPPFNPPPHAHVGLGSRHLSVTWWFRLFYTRNRKAPALR